VWSSSQAIPPRIAPTRLFLRASDRISSNISQSSRMSIMAQLFSRRLGRIRSEAESSFSSFLLILMAPTVSEPIARNFPTMPIEAYAASPANLR